ncbi:MFS transporter [Xanthomonas sp. WHRI 8391]|uniref:Multidrug resistance protein MdtG n=1 Tax=Xanthomonas hortorum pv. carotae TaxID=487904 RepID=A0A6V7CKI6_9XANT|nr:MFS transporter [Xanthomonas hortorum]ETC87181.1 major facilitator superfamily protein [Xanthomonas hortorum pv. carotae str. M081]UTS73235.1 MFS transporter [Xanthomonas hortorum]CAD0318268.1 Multidrug resistance protein MdtG [Xanthomonas hortorum pv. carotae]CAD0318281.1 Multidrug resistance protein MdtG [Xanthomonas hortorum pv. carotae]
MKRVLGPVLAAHYLAAFTALGMPLFLPQVLAELAPSAAVGWSGVLYVLPTLCTALTASTWGRLADRYGRKRSLLRAQLGLAVGFAIAGFAPSLTWLVIGLIVQGTCGGSLAAANAYLASQPQAGPLARALDWTQYSARLAMVSAPALLGLALALGPAQSLYRALALLPLLAFALTWRLPADRPAVRPTASTATSTPSQDAAGSARSASPQTTTTANALWPALLIAQFLFCFAMVVTFPYFIPYALARGAGHDALAGLLYSLPHLVYLVVLPWWRRGDGEAWLVPGLVLFAVACVWQALLHDPITLAVARVLFGFGMLFGLCGLNRSLAMIASGHGAGRLFGRFDACGKWAGVFAGAAAGALAQAAGPATPFLAAALAAAAAALTVLVRFPSRRSADVAAHDA